LACKGKGAVQGDIQHNEESEFDNGENMDIDLSEEKDDYSLKEAGMNKINASVILFNEPNKIFELMDDEGRYEYEYKMNTIFIEYWKKAADFDDDYQYFHKYYPKEYAKMEQNIRDGINHFNNIFFNQNISRNIKNNIIFIDSFCFSVFEAESIFLSRRIYLTTNNYNLQITIHIKNELINQMIDEVPQYFKIRSSGNDDIEYNNETKETGWVVWDYKNDARKMFGDNLLNGTHESEVVNKWFLETEEILNGIGIM
jgi:hypothetical protein